MSRVARSEWADESKAEPGCLTRICAFLLFLFFIWLGWRITYLTFFAPGM